MRPDESLKDCMKRYSYYGMTLGEACRNLNMYGWQVVDIAEAEGWKEELCDFFGLGKYAPRYEESRHEGMRQVPLSELSALTPQLHKRLAVRLLTQQWTKKAIKKGVMLHERRKEKPDRYA